MYFRPSSSGACSTSAARTHRASWASRRFRAASSSRIPSSCWRGGRPRTSSAASASSADSSSPRRPPDCSNVCTNNTGIQACAGRIHRSAGCPHILRPLDAGKEARRSERHDGRDGKTAAPPCAAPPSGAGTETPVGASCARLTGGRRSEDGRRGPSSPGEETHARRQRARGRERTGAARLPRRPAGRRGALARRRRRARGARAHRRHPGAGRPAGGGGLPGRGAGPVHRGRRGAVPAVDVRRADARGGPGLRRPGGRPPLAGRPAGLHRADRRPRLLHGRRLRAARRDPGLRRRRAQLRAAAAATPRRCSAGPARWSASYGGGTSRCAARPAG